MATTQQQEATKRATTAKQPAGKHMSPQHEHHWLEKLVGKWRVEGKMDMGNGKPAETTTGEETFRSIDGLWFVGEGRGEMPGGVQGTTMMTLGFDTRKNKYVGTFIGSMMTGQWVYEGELDANEKVLTLNTMGPEMGEGGMPGEKLVKYQDRIEFKDDNHRVLTSSTQGKDGKWRQFIEMHYYRKK